MRGGPEVLSWPSRDDARGPAEDDGPVDSWVDLGELHDETSGYDEPPDVRPARPSGFGRLPGAVSWLVVVGAVAALVVPALRSPSAPTTSADNPGIKDNVTRTDTSEVEQYPPWSPPQPTALPLPDRVLSEARSTIRLRDSVRPGGTRGDCPRPPSPAQAIVTRAMKAIDAARPGVKRVDSMRLTNSFGELCLLQLRARDTHGTVYVLTVVPPERWPGVHTQELQVLQSTQVGATSIRTVSETNPTGWRIDLGVVGVDSRLPDSGTIGDIADNPLMTW